MSVAGFVLTGGRSTRMGSDKALLPINGQALCEHVADMISPVCEHVSLVGHPERYAHLKYPCVADLHPDCGPISGVETLLLLGLADFNIVASCDVANAQPQWFRALLQEAQSGSPCVVAEDSDGMIHPLCGVYRRECGPVVSRARADGRWRMMELLQELSARTLKLDAVLLNLNTPEEYASGRK